MTVSEIGKRAERPASQTATSVRVWDPFVRLFHWSVVVGVLLNYAILESGKGLHTYVGYAVAALLALRVIWGFVGSRHARFADFVTGPRRILRHLRSEFTGRDRRYLGHNPAGGAMMVLLMILLAAICLTGWMQTLDAFWGELWVEDLHEILSNVLMVFVVLHVLAALVGSLRHRENLVRAMITGRKRAPKGTDVVHEGTAR